MTNQYTGTGTTRDRRTATYHVTRPVMDLEARDLRRGNWLAKRIIEMPPRDAYRRGYELKLGDKKQSERVQSVLEALRVNTHLVEAAQKEREAGGAALLPVFDGAVGSFASPLELGPNGTAIGKIRAIHLVEARELVPVSWYTRLGDPKYKKPEAYAYYPIGGVFGGAGRQIIHESRMAIFGGVKISDETLPGQRVGWGDSVLTPVQEVINDFNLSWGSAASIVHDFAQGVFKFENLIEILKEEGGWAAVEKRAGKMDKMRSSLRAMIIGAGDSFERQSTSVAGLAELLVQFMTLVSAAADMSVVRLFGISPAGMNATGQSDIELTDDRTTAHQADYLEPTEWLIKLVLNSNDGPTKGHEPEVWSAEWRKLRTPTEKEQADTRKTIAETDEIYAGMDASLVDSLITSRFKGDTFSAETVIDWAERDKQKKIQQEHAAEIDTATLEAMGRGVDAIAAGKAGAPTPKDPGGANPDDQPIDGE